MGHALKNTRCIFHANIGPDGAERGNVFSPANSLHGGFTHFGPFQANRDVARCINYRVLGSRGAVDGPFDGAYHRQQNDTLIAKRCRLLKNMAEKRKHPCKKKLGVLGGGMGGPGGGVSDKMRSKSTVAFRTMPGKRQPGDIEIRVGCLAGNGLGASRVESTTLPTAQAIVSAPME